MRRARVHSLRPPAHRGALNSISSYSSLSRSRRWTTAREQAIRNESRAVQRMAETAPDYSAWTHESLIERVTQLEEALKSKNSQCVYLKKLSTAASCLQPSDLRSQVCLHPRSSLEEHARTVCSILQNILLGTLLLSLPTWARTTMASSTRLATRLLCQRSKKSSGKL